MKFRPARLGLAQSLVALSVSLAVGLSSHTFVLSTLAKPIANSTAGKNVASSQEQADSSQSELRLISTTATATTVGVLLQWHTNSATDNLGFNVYRLKDGQRTRVNREIIPGAVFAPAQAKLRGGYSYSWFDRGGTADATYYIESLGLHGTAKTHEPLSVVTSKAASALVQLPEALSSESANATESTNSFEKYYPAEESQLSSSQGALEDQWAIAAQTALKIAIKKDGWYRVTQPQMVAAGFNPTVDIRNLRLFVEAQEVAINTSQHSGPFGLGDYIEFYGRGLDKPTTDTRIYYLIAGTTRGKRVRGQIQLDDVPILPPAPTSTPLPPPSPPSPRPAQPVPPAPVGSPGPILREPIFFSWAQRDLFLMMESLRPSTAPVMSAPKEKDNSPAAHIQLDPVLHPQTAGSEEEQTGGADGRSRSRRQQQPGDGRTREQNATASADVVRIDSVAANIAAPETSLPAAVISPRRLPAPGAASKSRKGRVSNKRKRNKVRREFRQKRNHAVVSTASASAAAAPPNFAYTAERKDRSVYFVTVLNGDQENFFGQVITFNPSNPASQTINTPNPDLAAAGTAQLEIALQGVNLVQHQISVEFNGVVLSPPFSFFGFDPAFGGHPVKVFNIPIAQLNNGANTIRFILPSGPDVSIVDYVKITYPHLFRADTGGLRFTLRGNQSVTVDGFATPSVRLIDYTDPLNVGISRPAAAPSGAGFAIAVPTTDPPAKAPRLLFAIADGQFDQPAALTLQQPSTLNQGVLSPTVTTGADF
jgi:hypothetical protein